MHNTAADSLILSFSHNCPFLFVFFLAKNVFFLLVIMHVMHCARSFPLSLATRSKNRKLNSGKILEGSFITRITQPAFIAGISLNVPHNSLTFFLDLFKHVSLFLWLQILLADFFLKLTFSSIHTHNSPLYEIIGLVSLARLFSVFQSYQLSAEKNNSHSYFVLTLCLN